MSTTNLLVLVMKVFGLLILVQINQVASADYSALLSRLYKRAAASDRPLIVLIDSNLLQSDRHAFKRPKKTLDAIAYNNLEYRGSPVNNLVQNKVRSQKINLYKPKKSYDIEKKLHHALLPMQKRVIARDKKNVRSPILRSLLRISRSLRCQAKNECEDQCNNFYNPGAQNAKCVDNCETTFTCDEGPESGCDDCKPDSCEEDDCRGSTKGYASTDPSVGCAGC